MTGGTVAMQHDDGRIRLAFHSFGKGQRGGNLMIAGVDGDILFGVGFSGSQRAAGDDHRQGEEQNQEFTHG